MRRWNRTAAGLLALALACAAMPAAALAQDVPERPRRASGEYDRSYQIGFDAGYRTGYEKGLEDFNDSRQRGVDGFREYRQGDTGYNSEIPNRQEYRNGFRAGFAQGYEDGSEGRAFGHRPGEARVKVQAQTGPKVLRRGSRQNDPAGDPSSSDPDAQARSGSQRRGQGVVAADTSLLIELETPISTELSQEGDRFTAKVVDNGPYAGARVDGYVGKVVEPGRVQGKAELVLIFQRIVLPDGYEEPIEAQVEEIVGYPAGQYPKTGKKLPWGKKDDRNAEIDATVDAEGRIEGTDAKKRDAATVGAGAVTGAIIGGILGGGGGAAAGAAVGGAAGGGVVAATKGHQIDLEPGCQLRIRTGRSSSL